MSEQTVTVLEVDRSDVGRTRLVSEAVHDLEPGQVRLTIDRFAITANNITYAVFGDILGYWDFFPTLDGREFGRVPAMGWATVSESNHDEIAVGERFYGWYPMASSVVFTPTPTGDGFRDDGEHRRAHAPVYRAYVNMRHDAMYPGGAGDTVDHDGEDRHVLLRGLFLTGFLAEEFFADGGGSGAPYLGAARVIVLSASSKTAIGFAQRAAARDGVEVVGVTSARNRAFVEELGFYDSVVAYDEIDRIPTDGGAVSIDMAGNPTALAAVHQRFGDDLAYSMTVGRSHHDATPSDVSMIGPEPQLFFAPTEVERRLSEWGRADDASRSNDALATFVDGSRRWLTVEHRVGHAATESAWADVRDAGVGPDTGLVATMGSSDPDGDGDAEGGDTA